MTRAARTGAALAAGVTASLLAVACGVPSSGFDPFDDADVPFGLADAPTTTVAQAAPTVAVTDADQRVRLYFVVEGSLTPVDRVLTAPVTLDGLLGLLGAGPAAEEDEELRTALPEGAATGLSVRAGVASVAVSRDFRDLAAAEQRLAVAQLVLTITSRPGIGQVLFTVDDEPVSVPKGDGSLADGPVSRDDYSALVSPPGGA
jgi:spore germination protein GerM